MWCPECNVEYEEGSGEICPECEGHLLEGQIPKLAWGRYIPGELLKKWPYNDEREPVKPRFLKHCSSVDMDDQLFVNMLEAYGIPSVSQYPQNGQLGKIYLGISGNGTDIFVPETMYELAIELISGEVDDAHDE